MASPHNVGPVDAAVRLAVSSITGIAAMDALVFFDGTTRWVTAGVLAFVAVLAGVTGVRRSCPAYRVARVSTLKPADAPAAPAS